MDIQNRTHTVGIQSQNKTPRFGAYAGNSLIPVSLSNFQTNSFAFTDVFTLQNAAIASLAVGTGALAYRLTRNKKTVAQVANQLTEQVKAKPVTQMTELVKTKVAPVQQVVVETTSPEKSIQPVISSSPNPSSGTTRGYSKKMLIGAAIIGIPLLAVGGRMVLHKVITVPPMNRGYLMLLLKEKMSNAAVSVETFIQSIMGGPRHKLPPAPIFPTELPKLNCENYIGLYIDKDRKGSKCLDMQAGLDAIGFPKIINNLSPEDDVSPITKALRTWSRTNHPDKGGNTQLFANVSTAVNDLLTILKQKSTLFWEYRKMELEDLFFNR